MRIACVGYRAWALEIYDRLASTTDHQFLIFRSESQFCEDCLEDFAPDIVLLYGWSWKISESLVKSFDCIMLHPSPLPKYRGGSPIQNQIIRGEIVSAVTLFLMDEGLDTGPILAQKSMSLEGGIDEIFSRMAQLGYELTIRLLNDGMKPVAQNDQEATLYSRRTPAESEITRQEIASKTAKYLNDKIRMLQPPYPRAFISTVDGKKLVILKTQIEDF